MNPSAPSSLTMAAGTLPCSSMSWAIGRSFSRAKSRAVRCTSACASVSARSKVAPVSVLVVVAMAVLLVHVDADVAALGIAGEEVVAEEVADHGLRGARLVVHVSDVVDAEPDDEAGLAAHFGRGLAVIGRVEHDIRVAGGEPARVRVSATPGPQSDDVAVEARRRGVPRGEREDRPHPSARHVAHRAYSKKPRPLLRPSQPACTY